MLKSKTLRCARPARLYVPRAVPKYSLRRLATVAPSPNDSFHNGINTHYAEGWSLEIISESLLISCQKCTGIGGRTPTPFMRRGLHTSPAWTRAFHQTKPLFLLQVPSALFRWMDHQLCMPEVGKSFLTI